MHAWDSPPAHTSPGGGPPAHEEHRPPAASITDPVVRKAASCPEADIDVGMWSAAETLCELLAANEKKIKQPHKAALVTGKAGLWASRRYKYFFIRI